MHRPNLGKDILAGLISTAAMTAVMLGEPLLGLPQIPVGWILAYLLDLPEMAGWVLHFGMGIVFAIIYDWFLNDRIPVAHRGVRGVVWGITIYIVAVICIHFLEMEPKSVPEPEPKSLFFLGYGICHVVFGYVLGLFYYQHLERHHRAHHKAHGGTTFQS